MVALSEAELKRPSGILAESPYPLSQWRWIVVNSSGGKDSQTALREVVAACDREGVDRARIVVSHQCLGLAEWPGTLELAQRQAAHYGVRFVVTRYRDRTGAELSFLDYVRRRRMWPSSQQRWCTSDFKRGPGARVIVQLSREAAGPVLNVFGFRSEESPARAKKCVFSRYDRLCRAGREVWDWLPIHDWPEQRVWDSIRFSCVPYHPAYDLGMPRLSCVFCIYAPKAALIIAGRANPALLDEYCAVEAEVGHSFQHGRRLAEVRDAIRTGEQPVAAADGAWNM